MHPKSGKHYSYEIEISRICRPVVVAKLWLLQYDHVIMISNILDTYRLHGRSKKQETGMSPSSFMPLSDPCSCSFSKCSMSQQWLATLELRPKTKSHNSNSWQGKKEVVSQMPAVEYRTLVGSSSWRASCLPPRRKETLGTHQNGKWGCSFLCTPQLLLFPFSQLSGGQLHRRTSLHQSPTEIMKGGEWHHPILYVKRRITQWAWIVY